MSSNCCFCKGKVTSQRKAIKCSEKMCSNIIHQECMLKEGALPDEEWCCKTCLEPSPSQIMKEIRKLAEYNVDIKNSIESCHEKIEENNGIVRELKGKLNECFQVIDELTTRCVKLEKENEELKHQISKQEQYSKLNNAEIFGIPEVRDENVVHTVITLSQALGVKLETKDIDACHRLGNSRSDNESRGIIIKFVSRIKKEEFIKARRIKRDFCLGDIIPGVHGLEAKKPVYINEHLSRENRSLYNICREYKKKHNIKFLWIKNGQILMRKAENSKVYRIQTKNSLNDVH